MQTATEAVARARSLESASHDLQGLIERAQGLCQRSERYADDLSGTVPEKPGSERINPTPVPNGMVDALFSQLRRLNEVFEETTVALNRIETAIGNQRT